MSFHLSVKVISIYQNCLYIPAEESMACSSLVAHGLCFLKTVSTPKEHSSLWLHHYSSILKPAQLWRKINSNGWKRELVPVSVVGVVGDLLSPWGSCPCWGLSCWLWLLCGSFVEAQGTSELKYSSLALASLKQLLYRGGILTVFLPAVLVSYITLLKWDFTFLLITWEGFLLLGLLGAVPWAVLVPALLQSDQCCDLCVCLPPPVITERLLGGRTWIRAEFHRSCSTHPGNSCLAASGCSSNWQLELEIVKHYIIYSFVLPCPSCCTLSCSSLALKPVWRAACSKSFPGELLGAFVTCCSVQGLGWKYQASSFPTLLYKKRGLQWKLFSFFMLLPCYVILALRQYRDHLSQVWGITFANRSREVRRSEKELHKFWRWRLERDQVIGTKRTRTNENLNKW